MKSTGWIAAILICLLSCKKNHESCEFEGTYELISFNYSTRLVFRTDQTFTLKTSLSNCFGGEKESIVNGRFTAKNDKIFLSPSSFHVVQHQQDSSVDRIVYDSVKPLSSLHRKVREYKDTLQILRYREHLFILGADQGAGAKSAFSGYSNDVITLLNFYNRNPEQLDYYDTQKQILNGFWNKLCAECTEKDLEKTLPVQWAGFILKHPVTAGITHVQKSNDRIIQYVVSINAGASKGVRPGMLFYPQQSSSRFDAVTITDVFENYSKGTITIGTQIDPAKAGVLSTRYVGADAK